MRLLVAEDEPLFRKLIEQVLSPLYDLTMAVDGEQAWSLLQAENPPRLLILDWVMPGICGPDLCRRIRQRDDGPGFYIVLLTMRNSPADITAGFLAGADDYLTKPVGVEELKAHVKIGFRVLDLLQTT